MHLFHDLRMWNFLASVMPRSNLESFKARGNVRPSRSITIMHLSIVMLMIFFIDSFYTSHQKVFTQSTIIEYHSSSNNGIFNFWLFSSRHDRPILTIKISLSWANRGKKWRSSNQILGHQQFDSFQNMFQDFFFASSSFRRKPSANNRRLKRCQRSLCIENDLCNRRVACFLYKRHSKVCVEIISTRQLGSSNCKGSSIKMYKRKIHTSRVGLCMNVKQHIEKVSWWWCLS